MKTSDRATDYIVVRASTNSGWIGCDFAIIDFSAKRRTKLEKWMRQSMAVMEDGSCHAICYLDDGVNFFSSEFCNGEIDGLPEGREWSFVELTEEEIETLEFPQEGFEGLRITILRNGIARYSSYDKETGEGFWTSDFPLL